MFISPFVKIENHIFTNIDALLYIVNHVIVL